MCIYDPDVDRLISRYIWSSWRLYVEGDIGVVLNTMKRDVSVHGPGISLVDCGCNIGLYTFTMASNGYRVLAIDAMNSSLQLVATSLRLADVTSRVTLLHNAISDKHEDVLVQVGVVITRAADKT